MLNVINNKINWYKAIIDHKNMKNTNKKSLHVDLLQGNECSNTFMALKLWVEGTLILVK
jgi:hypothetical protein